MSYVNLVMEKPHNTYLFLMMVSFSAHGVRIALKKITNYGGGRSCTITICGGVVICMQWISGAHPRECGVRTHKKSSWRQFFRFSNSPVSAVLWASNSLADTLVTLSNCSLRSLCPKTARNPTPLRRPPFCPRLVSRPPKAMKFTTTCVFDQYSFLDRFFVVVPSNVFPSGQLCYLSRTVVVITMAVDFPPQRMPSSHFHHFNNNPGAFLTCNAFDVTDQWGQSPRSHDLPPPPPLPGYIISINHWPQIWIFTSCNCWSSVCVLPSDKIDDHSSSSESSPPMPLMVVLICFSMHRPSIRWNSMCF